MAVGRLTVRRQFLFVAQGFKTVRPSAVVQARKGDGPPDSCRAGFTATKKVGGAVVRNRAKRRLREAARALLPLHGVPGTDYVFIARHQTAARDWSLLLEDVKSALKTLAPTLRGESNGPSRTGHGPDGR
ncbi:MAG TPA: ribonuclease P protein component [Alphaproteobacteria bacterium]|nr:ribonuclease P protein component [Alphaproteobacteria bacterium]